MDVRPTNDEATPEQNAYANANRILNVKSGTDSIIGYYDKWAESNDYDKVSDSTTIVNVFHRIQLFI